jgi:hypothetical protein
MRKRFRVAFLKPFPCFPASALDAARDIPYNRPGWTHDYCFLAACGKVALRVALRRRGNCLDRACEAFAYVSQCTAHDIKAAGGFRNTQPRRSA